MSDQSNERKARAEEKQTQAETKAQSAREAMADYRARETAADDNVNRLKALRLVRDDATQLLVEQADDPRQPECD